jgi:hypothetical protein
MPVQIYLKRKARVVFFLELQSSDMHAALGRLLDQARVAGLRLAAVSARAEADECRISVSIDIDDRDAIDRLARRVGTMVCIGAIEVRGKCEPAISSALP